MNLEPYHEPQRLTQNKQRALNVKANTIKIFEENTGANLYDLRFGNGFLYITPKP